jgi:hypothetical protein
MKINICIPTFGRSEIKTLKILSAFNKEDITIFPNNYGNDINEECDKLKLKYPEYKIVGLNTKGIGEARNGILDYHKIGERILMFDDDVEKFYRLGLKGLKKSLVEMNPEEIKTFVEDAFNKIEKFETKLWGIYPVENAFYMSQKLNPKGFIIGTVSGIIKSQLRYDPEVSFKEDYDFTIQHILKFKKVCRFENITVKAGHYSNAGGVCQQRKENPEREGEVAERLMQKYPGVVIYNSKRENEILINL